MVLMPLIGCFLGISIWLGVLAIVEPVVSLAGMQNAVGGVGLNAGMDLIRLVREFGLHLQCVLSAMWAGLCAFRYGRAYPGHPSLPTLGDVHVLSPSIAGVTQGRILTDLRCFKRLAPVSFTAYSTPCWSCCRHV
jgi:hypothetical protein